MNIENIIGSAITSIIVSLLVGPRLAWLQEDRRLDRRARSRMRTAAQRFGFAMERERALRALGRGSLTPNGFIRLFWPLVRAAQDTDLSEKTRKALDGTLIMLGGTATVRYLATCEGAGDVRNTPPFVALTFTSSPDDPAPIQTRMFSSGRSTVEPINEALRACETLEHIAGRR